MDFAKRLNDAIVKAGYTTFFDQEAIQVGEAFPDRIVSSIRKSDACLIIVSKNSVNSEWCKLESYYAHFFNKLLIPVKKEGGEYDLENPLRYIQKGINYAVVNDNQQPEEVMPLISRSLEAAQSKARKRVLRLAALAGCIILFIIAVFTVGIRQINLFVYEKDSKQFLEEVKTSNKIFRTKEIELYKNKFNNDHELAGQLHLQETDPGLSDIAKINSKIMSAALLQSFNLAQRQYYQNIDWKLSTAANNLFANSTFFSGKISQVNFNNMQFSDVYFDGLDSNSSSNKRGMELSADSFSNCSFNTVYFDKNNAIDLQFKNCGFKGSLLNTTYFGAVSFYSDTTTNSVVITNGQVTFFENCIFENDNEPDLPNVMVLGKDEEMQFKDVVFEKCRFIGLVRPEWFVRCSFNDCIFPKGFDESKLKKN